MKRVPIAVVAAVALLASCQDKNKDKDKDRPAAPRQGSAPSPTPVPPPASADPAPPEPPAPEICRTSVAAIEKATCKSPDGQKKLIEAKTAIDGVVETLGRAGGAKNGQFQVMCAQMLLALERDAKQMGCALALDAGPRKELIAFLEAWYARRTPVTPTGDAAADAVIAKIVAVRDAACACRDAACLDRVDKQLVGIGEMPPTAPPAARTLGSRLLEDAGRCAARVRTLDDAPAP